MSEGNLYGLLAEFDGAERLLNAVVSVRASAPDASLEAYSPFPIEGIGTALPARRDWLAPLMLLGALVGGAGTFAIESYSAILNYPINVGGRPPASWPAFLPPAIEMAVLFAVLFGVATLLVGSSLPRLHHPLFATKAFERATADRFFLLVRADIAEFDALGIRRLLDSLAPLSVHEVPE